MRKEVEWVLESGNGNWRTYTIYVPKKYDESKVCGVRLDVEVELELAEEDYTDKKECNKGTAEEEWKINSSDFQTRIQLSNGKVGEGQSRHKDIKDVP